MIDLIIPIYNEEKILREKKPYFSELSRSARIIFVDGGSLDKSAELAAEIGEVICVARGRGIQKTAGIHLARNPWIVILHVDTELEPRALAAIEGIKDPNIVGGCFEMRVENPGRLFKAFSWLINLRAKYFKVIDGDCGLFARADVCRRIGMFEPVPYMEDILFSRKLRKAGQVVQLPYSIVVSSRKWREQGFLKTFVNYVRAYVELWTKFQFDKNHRQCLQVIKKAL